MSGPLDRRVPWGLMASLAGATSALHLWVFANTNLSPDESYYLLWSRHLAWDYPDHPPGIAALLALVRGLGLPALQTPRFAALLVYLLCTLMLAVGVSRALGRARGGKVLWLLHATLLMQVLGIIATPDTPLTLGWCGTLVALLPILAQPDRLRYAGLRLGVAGLFTGLALLSKLTGWGLLAGGLLTLLVAPSSQRRLGRGLGWRLWIYPGVALLVAAPWILEVAGAFEGSDLIFQLARAAPKGTPLLPLFGFVGGQLAALGPGAFGLLVVWLWRLFQRKSETGLSSQRENEELALALGWRLLLLGAPLLLALTLLSLLRPIEANWAGPAWLPLLLGTCLLPWPRRLWNAVLVSGLLLGVLLQGVGVIGLPSVSVGGHPIKDGSARVRGWDSLGQELERLCNQNSPSTGGPQLEVQNYGLGASAASYAPGCGLALLRRGARARVFAGPVQSASGRGPTLYLAPCGRPPPDTAAATSAWERVPRRSPQNHPELCIWSKAARHPLR